MAVAGEMVGIHATDPASVYLGMLARVSDFSRTDMARALYDERSLLKILGMRRTMFVVPSDLAGVVNAAVTRALGAAERRRLLEWLPAAEVGDDPAGWLDRVETETVACLHELGAATASELTRRVPGLRVQIPFGEGKKWAGRVGVSTRLLFLLATEGRIIRGRPRGSWLSSMYAWAPIDHWVPGGLSEPPVEEAEAELVRRWLRTFGPGTRRDIQWWTGWTVATTKRGLAAVGAVEVALDGGTGYALPEDFEPSPDAGPWVALTPALDTTMMGWNEREWYLGNHGPRLFDRNGNAGPAVWADGRVVGGWAQRGSGELITRLFEDVGREMHHAIDTEAERVRGFIGDSRIVPRFRTPTEVDLS